SQGGHRHHRARPPLGHHPPGLPPLSILALCPSGAARRPLGRAGGCGAGGNDGGRARRARRRCRAGQDRRGERGDVAGSAPSPRRAEKLAGTAALPPPFPLRLVASSATTGDYWIWILYPCCALTLGSVMTSSPLLNSAVTLSCAISAGKVKRRSNRVMLAARSRRRKRLSLRCTFSPRRMSTLLRSSISMSFLSKPGRSAVRMYASSVSSMSTAGTLALHPKGKKNSSSKSGHGHSDSKVLGTRSRITATSCLGLFPTSTLILRGKSNKVNVRPRHVPVPAEREIPSTRAFALPAGRPRGLAAKVVIRW